MMGKPRVLLPPSRHEERLANCERMIAALVELASPEQLRKAIATNNTRTAMANIKAAVANAVLTTSSLITSASVAVQVREIRGDEIVTASVVLELAALTEDSRGAFAGKGIGDRVGTGEVVAEVVAIWDRLAPKRAHKAPKWKRHGRS